MIKNNTKGRKMSDKTQTLILNKRTLEILFRIGCQDSEIINLLKNGTHEKTGDNLIDDLLDELIIQESEETPTESLEPAPTARGGNHNPTGQNQYSDIETENKKEIYNQIVNMFGSDRKNLILIDKNFSCNNYDIFIPYLKEMPQSIIKSVENWLRKVKLNESVTVEFIIKQFFNFAQRANISIFKEKKNDGRNTIS